MAFRLDTRNMHNPVHDHVQLFHVIDAVVTSPSNLHVQQSEYLHLEYRSHFQQLLYKPTCRILFPRKRQSLFRVHLLTSVRVQSEFLLRVLTPAI